MAQWIRPRTLNREVPGSNALAAAVVLLGKALYPHCLVPWKGLKGCLLSYWPGKIKCTTTIELYTAFEKVKMQA